MTVLERQIESRPKVDEGLGGLNYSATFVMEQVLGHVSHYKNLRQSIEPVREVASRWVEVTYTSSKNPLPRLPFIPKPLVGYATGLFQTAKGIWQGRKDSVIFFHTQKPAVLLRPFLRRKPFVVSLDVTPAQYDRFGDIYEDPGNTTGLFARFKNYMNVRLFRSAHLIVSWSEWVRESLCTDYGVDPGKVVVIPPGIDLERWQAGELPRPQRKLPRVLFCGGDWERKGGPLLLEWFKERGHRICELHLVTRAKIENQEGVPNLYVYNNFNSNDPTLIQLYRDCDLFALPSLAECFGIAMVEALAMGLPVITTSVGAGREIVEDGKTGYVVEPGNREELGQRLEELLANYQARQCMSLAAQERAKILFDARKNGHELLQVLAQVVK